VRRAQADEDGAGAIPLGASDAPRIFGLSMLASERTVQAEGYQLVLPDGRLVLLRAGAGAALPASAPARQESVGAVAFDVAKLDGLRAANKPVFLYFTADWCLTCKANEAAAIDRAETRAAFDRAGVTVMVGDWTSADPAITRFLESQGRSGVPLYLWYAPGKEARTLPQLLTPATLTGLVR